MTKVIANNGYIGIIEIYQGIDDYIMTDTNSYKKRIRYNKNGAPYFVENKQRPDFGIRFANGLSIAIEPMFVIGSTKTTVSKDDGWTVYTQDIGVHFEDTVTLFDNETHLITGFKGDS